MFTLHVNDVNFILGPEGGGDGVTDEKVAKPVSAV